MRLLLIHADFLEFRALEPTPFAEEAGRSCLFYTSDAADE